MDKEQLGSFISQLRKEQNMTQKELANLLCVTDKAVSKWERGLSFPDISLLEPIAAVFDISIPELLQGKRLPKEEPVSVEEVEKVLDDSLHIFDSELHRKHVISKSIILLCCVSLMLLISIILNIINLSKPETENTGASEPNLHQPAYEITTGENGLPIFQNPEDALEQMKEDATGDASEEWSQLLEILHNTYKEVNP